MRKATKRLCAAMLSLCLLGSVTSGVTAAAGFSADTIKGSFCQAAAIPGSKNYNIETYTYSDSYFNISNAEYQPRLATSSAYLAMAASTSARTDETHGADRDVRAFLEEIGFHDIRSNADYDVTPTADTIGVSCGVKTITDADGKTYTLLAVAPRGSGYGAEWASNFRLGKEGNASGFSEASGKVLDFIKSYAAEQQLSGDLKLWLTGYSRAGAVADLTAAALIDDAASVFGEAAVLEPAQIYAYTFEAPMAADTANQPRADRYRIIYNVLSRNDAIPCIASPGLGFDRYGTDHFLEDYSTFEEMMAQLNYIHQPLHAGYLYGYSPLDFRKRLLGIAVDGSTGEYPVDANSTNRLPETQAEFIRMLADSLTGSVKDRADYAENVEPYLSELTGLLIPSMLSDTEPIKKAAAQSRYSLPLLVYLYMDYELSRIPAVIEEYPDQPEQVELFFNKTNRLALLLRALAGDYSEEDTAMMQTFIRNLKPDEQEWMQEVFGDFSPEALAQAREKTGFSGWNLSDECIGEMKQIFDLYRSYMEPAGEADPDTGVIRYTSYTPEHYAEETAFVKEHLAENYKGFMQEFLTAYGLPADIVAHQTEETACRSMPGMIEYFLLDSPNRTDKYTEDIEDGESCGKLATILGNVNNILYAHSMGAVLAWVRAEDADYDDFVGASRGQKFGCRRIRITKSGGSDAVVSGTVYDAAGETVAAFQGNTMVSSADDWIRLNGDCLRLPLDREYTVELTSSGVASFALAVEEYSTYEGRTVHTYTSDAGMDWSALTLRPGDTCTLDVPKILNPDAEWANSSKVVYTLQKTEAEPAPTEATAAETQFTDERLCEMAVKEYQDKTGAVSVRASAAPAADGTLAITLTDAQGQLLDTYRVSPETGEGTNAAGESINLPQTGTNTPAPLLGLLAGLASLVAGAWTVRRARLFRK